jgi:hypothetical protein
MILLVGFVRANEALLWIVNSHISYKVEWGSMFKVRTKRGVGDY